MITKDDLQFIVHWLGRECFPGSHRRAVRLCVRGVSIELYQSAERGPVSCYVDDTWAPVEELLSAPAVVRELEEM